MKRKRVFQALKETLKDAFDWIERMKSIYRNEIQVEMNEFQMGDKSYWDIVMWKVR